MKCKCICSELVSREESTLTDLVAKKNACSSPSSQFLPQVLLLLAGLLLCLHLSEGFSYRGNVMRNRNRGGGGRGYLYIL